MASQCQALDEISAILTEERHERAQLEFERDGLKATIDDLVRQKLSGIKKKQDQLTLQSPHFAYTCPALIR